MYGMLTVLIEKLENESFGELVIDTNGKGTIDDPLHLPHDVYTDAVTDLWKAIYAFSKEHPEYEQTNYQDILTKSSCEWIANYNDKVDVASADG